MTTLPPPPSLAMGADRADVVRWVGEHLGDLALEGAGGIRAGAITGGQRAADEALAALDITGHARNRSTVLPVGRRGASRLSPYIRHGLLTLPAVWDAVHDAAADDRRRFRDELLWQEPPGICTRGRAPRCKVRCDASNRHRPGRGTANPGRRTCAASGTRRRPCTRTAGW